MTNYEVFCNGTDYTYYMVSFDFVERLDELGSFKVVLNDVSVSNTDVSLGKIVKIKLDGVQFFKGRIESQNITSDGTLEITGYDMGIKLVDRKMTRYEATNRNPTGTSPSIVTDIVSENLDGTGTAIMQIGTNTAYGAAISIRAEYDNRLRGIAATTNAIGWDWWVDQDGSDVDQINVDDRRGSATSVYTFDVGSGGGNAVVSTKTTDRDSMVNWLTLLGYGDGVNQLKVELFASSATYTTLSANATATAGTISCVDLSSFPSTSNMFFRIGDEIVQGTKSTNDITVSTKGRGILDFGTGTVSGSVLTDSGAVWTVNAFIGSNLTVAGTDYTITSNTKTTITVSGTPASGSQNYKIRNEKFIHFKGCFAMKYGTDSYTTKYTPTSPEAGSAIATSTLKENRITKAEIISLPTLELLATQYILDRMSPVTYISLESGAPEEQIGVVTVGDTVTINDSEVGFASSEYRVVGRELTVDLYEGSEILKFFINDKQTYFIDDVSNTKDDTDTINAYMNGATNIYIVNNYENVDSSNPMNLRFYIPTEAVGINHVKLSFKRKNYRVDSTVTTSGGGATSGDGGGTTVSSAAFSGGGSIYAATSSEIAAYNDSDTANWKTNFTYFTVASGTAMERYFIYCSLLGLNVGGIVYVRVYDYTDDIYYPSSSGLRCEMASDQHRHGLDTDNSDHHHGYLPPAGAGTVRYKDTGGTESWANVQTDYIQSDVSGLWGHTEYADTQSEGAMQHTFGTAWFLIPKNMAGHTLYIQVKVSGRIDTSYNWYLTLAYDAFGEMQHFHSVTVPNHTHTTPDHSHTLNYGIGTGGTLGNVTIKSGIDGGTLYPTSGLTYSSDTNDVDLTPYVNQAGQWYNVEISSATSQRIEANVYVQTYLQSK